jgi:hypothetical protein
MHTTAICVASLELALRAADLSPWVSSLLHSGCKSKRRSHDGGMLSLQTQMGV